MLDSVTKSLSSLTLVEIIFIVLFLCIVLFPFPLPYWLGFYIDSSLGFITLFIITLLLFYYYNPILGVLFLFVSYDLLRRSTSIMPKVPIISYTPTQDKKDEQMLRLNPIHSMSLEEQIVSDKAPVDGSKTTMNLISEMTSYKPISSVIQGSAW